MHKGTGTEMRAELCSFYERQYLSNEACYNELRRKLGYIEVYPCFGTRNDTHSESRSEKWERLDGGKEKRGESTDSNQPPKAKNSGAAAATLPSLECWLCQKIDHTRIACPETSTMAVVKMPG
ncbi:hypothetical protein PsorP6_006244 [Peronosclerospora sorghi]|uniref:Uncharacterized protein n=1 Tax=Peronosclerospora sorghi TaxID=230839 RepID=A0ACC0W5T6_9STRA|nr:hypothetical protein PsorP6_006244 [Peronosclerospora sorghi]